MWFAVWQWHPVDVHAYLRRETENYRRSPGWGHYNEFIVDGTHWDTHLPLAIEAFMSSRNREKLARVHKGFLRRYGMSADGVDGVPLLTMTPSIEQPFVVGSTYSSHGDPTRLGGRV